MILTIYDMIWTIDTMDEKTPTYSGFAFLTLNAI